MPIEMSMLDLEFDLSFLVHFLFEHEVFFVFEAEHEEHVGSVHLDLGLVRDHFYEGGELIKGVLQVWVNFPLVLKILHDFIIELRLWLLSIIQLLNESQKSS